MEYKMLKDRFSKTGVRVLLFIVCLLISSSTYAQLHWDNQEIEVKHDFKSDNIRAEFTFSNVGDYPINFITVRALCKRCTVAKMEKTVYTPGEKGKIDVSFNYEHYVGEQIQKVFIKTDDPKEPITQLILRAFIPKLVKLRPRFLCWKIGEEKTPKTIQVKIVYEKPINITEVTSSNNRLMPSLKTIEPGREYEIMVKPTDTDGKPTTATLYLSSDFPPHNPKAFQAYAIIRRELIKPESLNIMPRHVQWDKGEDVPKTINIEVLQKSPVNIVGIESTSDNFKAELKTVIKGEEYEVTIEPVDAEKTGRAILNIKTDFPKDTPESHKMILEIK